MSATGATNGGIVKVVNGGVAAATLAAVTEAAAHTNGKLLGPSKCKAIEVKHFINFILLMNLLFKKIDLVKNNIIF
jgi:hypothetical protein